MERLLALSLMLNAPYIVMNRTKGYTVSQWVKERRMNPNLIPLAHGALGPWDEIIPAAVVLILGIALAAAAIMGHRKDKEDEATADQAELDQQPNAAGEMIPADQSADHFRLD